MPASTGVAIHSPRPPVPVMAGIYFVVFAAGVARPLTFGCGH